MLLWYDLRHKCAQFISFIFLISCHSCKFNFYTKKRSHILHKNAKIFRVTSQQKLERSRLVLTNGLS